MSAHFPRFGLVSKNHLIQHARRVLKPRSLKGRWSFQERERLEGVLREQGSFAGWSQIASLLESRNDTQVRYYLQTNRADFL